MHDATLPAPLSDGELVDLIQRVFAPTEDESHLALLMDFPDEHTPDEDAWCARRRLLADWQRRLAAAQEESGLECRLYGYRNVRANNADLPINAHRLDDAIDHGDGIDVGAWQAEDLESLPAVLFEDLLADIPIFVAATQFSATAPLKLMSARHGCRAATMPGFHASMVDALRLDYGEVDRQVKALAARLSAAEGADFHFRVAPEPGSSKEDETPATYHLHLDLRHRQGHASGGLVRQAGQAGNLPSGEAYIVPYEGEVSGQPSRTEGVLPVQLDGEVVLYRIAENRAVEVISQGPVSAAERDELEREPAYGNMAELGLGVLAGFGVQPVGTLLLDEKLGLHIAFGRSDHFGGQVGAKDFSSPQAVVHIDRVYLPETQPMVQVEAVDLRTADGSEPLMRQGRYVS